MAPCIADLATRSCTSLLSCPSAGQGQGQGECGITGTKDMFLFSSNNSEQNPKDFDGNYIPIRGS